MFQYKKTEVLFNAYAQIEIIKKIEGGNEVSAQNKSGFTPNKEWNIKRKSNVNFTETVCKIIRSMQFHLLS